MNELKQLINKTASSLKRLFVNYFEKKNEIELLKIRKILDVYFTILKVLEKKHDLTEYMQGNKDVVFIENCYRYVAYHSIILKEIAKEIIKEYIKK